MSNFNSYKFQPSSVGKLLTEPRSKADKDAGNFSETTKTYLLEIYIQQKYGRKKDISNKYIEKGLESESDSITLYSRYKKEFYKKNLETFSNDFLIGTPDIVDPLVDIKSSWNIYSFFDAKMDKLNPMYAAQVLSYMALTDKKSATVAYCLVNTPDKLIEDEVRKLSYKIQPGELFDQASEELYLSMRFDDIPINERVHEFTIERDDTAIQNIYNKIIKAREFLNTL